MMATFLSESRVSGPRFRVSLDPGRGTRNSGLFCNHVTRQAGGAAILAAHAHADLSRQPFWRHNMNAVGRPFGRPDTTGYTPPGVVRDSCPHPSDALGLIPGQK